MTFCPYSSTYTCTSLGSIFLFSVSHTLYCFCVERDEILTRLALTASCYCFWALSLSVLEVLMDVVVYLHGMYATAGGTHARQQLY